MKLEKMKHLKPMVTGSSTNMRARNRSNVKGTFAHNMAVGERNRKKIGEFRQERNIGGR